MTLPCFSRCKKTPRTIPDPEDEEDPCSEAHGFGARDIGLVGAIALTANNIMGSGMSILPGLFQGAGWVLSTGLFLFIGSWTAASCLFLAKSIASMPDNRSFRHRWEYAPLAKALLPNWAFHTVLWMLALSFISQNISNVVQSSQVMDSVLLAIAGRTCAFSFSGIDRAHNATHDGTGPFDCVTANGAASLTDSPFGSAYVISAGYAVTMLATLPLSFFPLDDSIAVQVGGVLLVMFCCILWAVQFVYLSHQGFTGPLAPLPLGQALPAFGNSIPSFTSALSTVLFNYGFVSTIPSFLSEKSPNTSTITTTLVSVIISTSLFFVLGIFGAIGGNWSSGLDILSFLADSRVEGVWKVSKICLYIFPAANLM
jgi:amino acid permease